MRALKALVVEKNTEEIQSLKEFEEDNRVLFTVVEYLTNLDNLIFLINEHKPDVLIVGVDNIVFETAHLQGVKVHKPKLIFISKEKNHACDAFRNNAIEFIHKPLLVNTLIISIYKAIKYIEMESAFQELSLGRIEKINSDTQNSKYISIASVDRIELLKVSEIIFCKADGKYTEFYTTNHGKIVSSKNLGQFEDALKSGFFRVHHSYIININFINKIKKENGTFCELTNGEIIPVSKRRQDSFIKYINK